MRTSSSTMLYERPYSHTHMHTHKHYTLYALTLHTEVHSTCTCASVLHATCTQIAHHAFLYQNAYDALTSTLTYPHSHLHSHSHHNARRHKRNLTRKFESQPLNNTRKPTARAISITLAPTFVSVRDRRDSERKTNTEVRGRVT